MAIERKHAIGFSIFAACVFMLMQSVISDTAVTHVTLGNDPPTVGTVTCNTTVNLVEHGTVLVVCSATLTDVNGFQDITSANGTFYLWNTTNKGDCSSNNAICYHSTNANCSMSGGSGNTINAACEFTVSWYAESTIDNGNWTGNISASDRSGSRATNASNRTSVSDLVALDSVSLIDFGDLAIGADSANITGRVNNTGNVRIDLQVNGTQMVCNGIGSANISVGQVHYNVTQGGWPSMCALTGTATDTCAPLQTNFDLYEGPDNSNNRDTFWVLRVPTGVGGDCNGTATFTAIKD